jgi:hypothetical protein
VGGGRGGGVNLLNKKASSNIIKGPSNSFLAFSLDLTESVFSPTLLSISFQFALHGFSNCPAET